MIRLIQPRSRTISSFFGGILDKKKKGSISCVMVCPARKGLVEAIQALYEADNRELVLKYDIHTIQTRGKLSGITLENGVPSAISADTGATRNTIVGVAKEIGEPAVRSLQQDHLANEKIIEQLYEIAKLVDDAGMYLRDYLPEACTVVDGKVVLCDLSSLVVGRIEKKARYGLDFERRRVFIDVLFCAASIDRELNFNAVDRGDIAYFAAHLAALKKDSGFKDRIKPCLEAMSGKEQFKTVMGGILKGTASYEQLLTYSGSVYRVADITWKVLSRNSRVNAMEELPTFRPFTNVGFIVTENYILNLLERITGASLPKESKEAAGAEGKTRKLKPTDD